MTDEGNPISLESASVKPPQQDPILQLSPQGEIVRMMGSLTTSLTKSLADLEMRSPDVKTNLASPGRFLLFLGGAMIFVSIALRVIPRILTTFTTQDFIAAMTAACVLELAGV